jgi:hypothetical protein
MVAIGGRDGGWTTGWFGFCWFSISFIRFSSLFFVCFSLLLLSFMLLLTQTTLIINLKISYFFFLYNLYFVSLARGPFIFFGLHLYLKARMKVLNPSKWHDCGH